MCSCKKNSSRFTHVHFVWHIFLSAVIIGLHIFFFKNRHNSIKLCWNKSKKMPRLNNDERNQATGMLNAGMSATVVLRHYDCAGKTIERLRRQFCVRGNIANRPRSGRPHVTTAAGDCYISLQHLCNRRLTAAATRRQYGIHPQTVRNRLRQNVQPICAYQPYFRQILTRCPRTARWNWCRCLLHFWHADWDLIVFRWK